MLSHLVNLIRRGGGMGSLTGMIKDLEVLLGSNPNKEFIFNLTTNYYLKKLIVFEMIGR